jgi:transposase
VGRHSKEFKVEAVRLLELGEKRASELALELGVKRTLLYRWRDQLRKKGEAAFSGGGRPRNDQLSEVARLKKELKEVTEERDILKKAAAYFAKGLK